MNTQIAERLHNKVVAYPTMIALLLYIFCYQFAYPFSSTIFLYITFGGFLLLLFLSNRIHLSKQSSIMSLVVLVSVLGAFYTDNSEKGIREAIVTVVTWILLIALSQYGVLLNKLKKAICKCSIVVLIGVLLQYLFSNFMNELLSYLLREDSYERLMLSFDVDGAYAGFSAYTPDAAYFCALLFGFAIYGYLKNEKEVFRHKYTRNIILALSIFAIILTSKRGVALALLIALAITHLIDKEFSFHSVITIFSLSVAAIVGIMIIGLFNESVGAFLLRFEATEGGDITTGRGEIWQGAIDNLSNIIIGMGTGASYTIFDAGLHNIYLQLFYDHGIIGVFVYIVFFYYNLKLAIKRKELISIFIQLLVLIYGLSGNPIYSNSFFIVYIIFSLQSIETTNKPAVS